MILANPRSTLHALKPMGIGSTDVESLTSYLCRLAVSHSVSLPSMAKLIAGTIQETLRENFDWHERQLSGISETAHIWASAISMLTGVGSLDQLTLSPWAQVIPAKGLITRQVRWCPDCFRDDTKAGHERYYRLSWNIGVVTICHKHHRPLILACPECGRVNQRHKASYVIPGWCSNCGCCLAEQAAQDLDSTYRVKPEEMWIARQIGLLLACQTSLELLPSATIVRENIRLIITGLDHGIGANFAKRIGVSKSSVHYWLNSGGLPTLNNLLQIAAHSGISLADLLTQPLKNWTPPIDHPQIALDLGHMNKERLLPRVLDWEKIKTELMVFARLPVPISVAEAGRRLEIDDRYLYLQANQEARVLGVRWKQYVARRKYLAMLEIKPTLESACREIIEDGRSINLREIERKVPYEILMKVEHLYDVLNEIKEKLRIT
ncbi:helix-turn-helix domain-containing protein [Iodobacter sp. HSC-16F04]|uniref:Helix-turn-helix domain-containing protein n=1 Tax=Iodobacter violaceini TaxID=3044271 RepID=A0ABX0KLQ8_9NEIS|nr:TniQ family protein [Iodobacter violacea]NHQ84850.1 helix-turn-helix domain-containing protein [Iodobacter violacea]